MICWKQKTINEKNQFIKNDKALILTDSTQVDRTLSIFGKDEKFAKKILIIGGGNIGLDLAKLLEENQNKPRIKIIEKDSARAQSIANDLKLGALKLI